MTAFGAVDGAAASGGSVISITAASYRPSSGCGAVRYVVSNWHFEDTVKSMPFGPVLATRRLEPNEANPYGISRIGHQQTASAPNRRLHSMRLYNSVYSPGRKTCSDLVRRQGFEPRTR